MEYLLAIHAGEIKDWREREGVRMEGREKEGMEVTEGKLCAHRNF